MHGGDDAERGEGSRKEVADAGTRRHPTAPGRSGGGDHATHRLRHDVEGGPVGVGALAGARVAEAADGGVDDARVAGAERLVADAQAVDHAHPGILDHRVDRLGEAKEGIAVLLGLEIEDDAALVAVDAGEVAPVVAPLRVVGSGSQVARHVPERWLHLDHVRAEIREQHGAEGPREGLGEVEDAQVGQRSGSLTHLRGSPWPSGCGA